MVQILDERMLRLLNVRGYRLDGGKQRKFPSHSSAFLSSVKQEVAYTAEREGEIGEIRDVKRVEKISVILRERDKSW